MASIKQPQFGLPLPAPAQIALALVMLKSKPREATVEGYLTQLRDRVVEGCAFARKLSAQHFDGAGYWKNAFDKSEEEKNALLDKLHDFEIQKAATTLLSSSPGRSPLIRDGKRGREDTPAAIANSRSKRRRANPSRTSESSTDNGFSNGHGEVSVAGEGSLDATKLLQAFFTLRTHLGNQPPALPVVQASASRLCHTISLTVRSIVDSNTMPDRDRSDGITSVWLAIRRIYHSLLETVELLHAHSSNAGNAMNLISELAKLLTELLKGLQSIAIREKPTRRRVRTRSDSRDVEKQIEGLTNLISGMMTDLDLAKVAHRELFDGLLCTFLDYLGSNLSLAVFSHPMTQGLPHSVGLLPLQDLSTGLDDHAQADVSTALKVAPYLVNILRRTKPRVDERGNNENNGYAGAVVDKLQNTLLRALFGGQDKAFEDSLQRPAEVENIDDTENLEASTEEDITSEWFIGEVWNNVGWDILTKHMT